MTRFIARTRKDYLKYFREDVLPAIRSKYEQDGRVDHVVRRETWNDLTDAYVREGLLPRRALTWSCPW